MKKTRVIRLRVSILSEQEFLAYYCDTLIGVSTTSQVGERHLLVNS